MVADFRPNANQTIQNYEVHPDNLVAGKEYLVQYKPQCHKFLKNRGVFVKKINGLDDDYVFKESQPVHFTASLDTARFYNLPSEMVQKEKEKQTFTTIIAEKLPGTTSAVLNNNYKTFFGGRKGKKKTNKKRKCTRKTCKRKQNKHK
jgi:hypothetical protein